MREEDARQLRFVAMICLIGGGACCLWNVSHLVMFLRFLRHASATTGVVHDVRLDAGQTTVGWRFETPDGRARFFEQRVGAEEAYATPRWSVGESAAVAYDPSDPVGTAVLTDLVLSDDKFYALLGASILGVGICLRRWGMRGRRTTG